MSRLPYSPALTFALLTLLFFDSHDAAAAENYLPTIGGTGGAQFIAPCPGGQNLAGFELRAGDDIDAIHPVCVSAYDTRAVDPPLLTEGSGLVQHYRSANREVLGEPYSELLGDWSTLPEGWHGGIGGGRASVICPGARPIVVGIDVAAEGVNTVTVNNIHLFCAEAVAPRPLEANPSAIFDAPQASRIVSSASQRCPEGQIAVGVHGRSGEWLDAIGLICDAPRISHALVLGRVKRAEGVPNPNAGKSFCELAAAARAANRPTATALQQRCDAQLAASAAVAPVPAPAPAPADAPSPPVRTPHDLVIGPMSYTQNGQWTNRPVVGQPVAINCNYVVDEAAGQFNFAIRPWQGLILIGGQVPKTITFQGDPRAGQHEARHIWTPSVAGKTPIFCVLNPAFEEAEASSGNNRANDTIDVVSGDEVMPPADDAAPPAQ